MILQMKSWIRECKDQHNDCKTANVKKYQEGIGYRPPSRLLEVRNQDGEVSVRLISTKDIPSDTKYMTLSYRWPKESVVRLLQANEASFRQRIDFHELPKTIQHAMLLVNIFECEYLWVDALCIMQDSELDWLQESAKMCDYYSHSALSISASTIDPDLGFLGTRNPLAVMPCRIMPKGKADPVFIRQVLSDSVNSYDSLKEHPVHQRGWVFQERMLAPRILHFTDVEVVWECATDLASDIYPTQPWDATIKKWLAGIYAAPEDSVDRNDSTEPSENHHPILRHRGLFCWSPEIEVWPLLIEQYSTLNLTYESDRLAAIGGLARQAQKVTSGNWGRYLAGIWERDLAIQLDWSTDFEILLGVPKNPRSEIYKAPSWSWASVNCGVRYERSQTPTDDRWFDFVDVNLEYALGVHGPVKSGWLCLRGSLVQMNISYPAENANLRPSNAFPLIDILLAHCIGVLRFTSVWTGTPELRLPSRMG